MMGTRCPRACISPSSRRRDCSGSSGSSSHGGELPMLVYALKYTTDPPRREPFVILGPPGVVQLLRTLAEGYGAWLLDPGFPIGILDVRDGEPFPLNADVSLETCHVPHTPESVAVSVTAPEEIGRAH